MYVESRPSSVFVLLTDDSNRGLTDRVAKTAIMIAMIDTKVSCHDKYSMAVKMNIDDTRPTKSRATPSGIPTPIIVVSEVTREAISPGS